MATVESKSATATVAPSALKAMLFTREPSCSGSMTSCVPGAWQGAGAGRGGGNGLECNVQRVRALPRLRADAGGWHGCHIAVSRRVESAAFRAVLLPFYRQPCPKQPLVTNSGQGPCSPGPRLTFRSQAATLLSADPLSHRAPPGASGAVTHASHCGAARAPWPVPVPRQAPVRVAHSTSWPSSPIEAAVSPSGDTASARTWGPQAAAGAGAAGAGGRSGRGRAQKASGQRAGSVPQCRVQAGSTTGSAGRRPPGCAWRRRGAVHSLGPQF
jgi:hypothetical protein